MHIRNDNHSTRYAWHVLELIEKLSDAGSCMKFQPDRIVRFNDFRFTSPTTKLTVVFINIKTAERAIAKRKHAEPYVYCYYCCCYIQCDDSVKFEVFFSNYLDTLGSFWLELSVAEVGKFEHCNANWATAFWCSWACVL